MGKSKVRTLLVACVMIMLCAATIVGGTYALWTENVEVNNHLSAGKLDVELNRTYLKTHALGQNGRMADTTYDRPAAANENYFGIGEGHKIVPTATYEARLELSNIGDVAVDYVIKITVDSQSAAELAKQVKVYIGTGEASEVTYDNGKMLATDAEGTVSFAEIEVAEGFLNANAKTEVWVKIEFVDASNNNVAQEKEASFDLLVEATQKVD